MKSAKGGGGGATRDRAIIDVGGGPHRPQKPNSSPAQKDQAPPPPTIDFREPQDCAKRALKRGCYKIRAVQFSVLLIQG